jgi:hypothetical protein
MKCIEPRRRPIRYIRLRRVKKREGVLVGFIVGDEVGKGSQRDPNERPPETGPRDPKTSEPSPVLLKALEETNHWARLAFQLYLGWFALQFTVNGLAIGWLLAHRIPEPWFASLAFLVFIGWNLMGAIGSVVVYKDLAEGDLRMREVIQAMAKHHQTYDDFWTRPVSPMPRRAISIVFGFCVVTMFISLAFWIVLFVAGL